MGQLLQSGPTRVNTASVEFCELDWDEAMAHPKSSLRHVLTLSARDVRQRVHSRSVGRWRAEAETIRPFIDALDPDLWPELGAA